MGPEGTLLGSQPLAHGDVGGGQHEELPVGGGVNRPVLFTIILCVPVIYVLVGISIPCKVSPIPHDAPGQLPLLVCVQRI